MSLLLVLSLISSETKKAPNFVLENVMTNKMVEFYKLKGKVYIIDFWATWCPPCRRQIPILIELHEKYKNQGLVVIGIALERDKQKVRNFHKVHKIPYPVLMGNAKVARDFGGIMAIPTLFVIDGKFNIIKKFIGLTEKEEFENIIKLYLKSSSKKSQKKNK